MDVVSYLLGKKAGESPAPTPTYQQKEIEITTNGETNVTADSGYDALSKVKVTTNVPQPSGTINITENGTVNVNDYASANVNVQPNLETKSVTITENTTTTITPTSGKDGLSSVEVITNVSGDKYAPYYVTFQNGGYIYNLDYEVANIDTKNISNMSSMFYGDAYIQSLDLSGWNTSNVTTMSSMFQACSSLSNLNISNFNTSEVTNMSGMFRGSHINTLSLGENFDTSKVTTTAVMFGNCNVLSTINFSSAFILSVCTSMQNMFQNCYALNNNTLNAILHVCTTATSLAADNKTLKYIGLSSTQATTCQSLSNWQEFVDAGWTTGY